MAPFNYSFILLALLTFVGGSACAQINHRRQSDCLQTSAPNFNIQAVYKDDPSTSVPIKVIGTNSDPHVGYAILSSCPSCVSTWAYNILQNGGLLPKSTTNPQLNTVSFSLLEGESPSFKTMQFPPPPYAGYCLMENSVQPDGPLLLAGKGYSDLWALCPNSTAGGRVDVVYAPKLNHTHYLKNNCRDVYLEQV